MSVSQVKKRFGQMESFLGKDKEGLRRLKLLKDDVNILRTSLAATEEAKDLADTIKDAARERADKAESEAESLTLEVHRLTQKLSSVMAELASATKPDDELTDDETDGHENQDVASAISVLRLLRRQVKRIPLADDYCEVVGLNKVVNKCLIYNRETLIKDWSYSELWKLGATVAVYTFFNGRIMLTSREMYKKSGHEMTDKQLYHAIQFIKNVINTSDTADSVACSLTDY